MATQQPAPAEPFVLVGTVKEVGASAMPEIPATASTATIEIEEVLRSPASLGNLVGRTITIDRGRSRVVPGVRRVFHGHGWAYGSGLAIRVTQIEPFHDSAAAHQDAASAMQRSADQALLDRLASAETVVEGRVLRVSAPEERGQTTGLRAAAPRSISEHDPLLADALVEVHETLKGHVPNEAIIVPFPTSRDIAWRDVPKLSEGQEGVFVLHTDQSVMGLAADELFAPYAIDVQPVERLEEIRELLRRS
jgi:hypothetical protein